MKYAFRVTDTSVSEVFEAPDYSLPIRSGGERLKVFDEREKAERSRKMEAYALGFSGMTDDRLSEIIRNDMGYLENRLRLGIATISTLTGIPSESLSALKRGKYNPPYRVVAAVHIFLDECIRLRENNSGMLWP